MKWTAIAISALLLGGCASRSIPNLEDVPPTAHASTASGRATGSEQQPAQGSSVTEEVTDSGRGKPPAPQQPAQGSRVSGEVTDSVDPPAEQQSALEPGVAGAAPYPGQPVKLTAQQRSDIEQGVRRGLPGSNPARFGPMAATISRVTSKSYIVCGWVENGEGYRPFLAMYVPYMRTALLVGVAGKQPEELIRQRCVDEGVRLPS